VVPESTAREHFREYQGRCLSAAWDIPQGDSNRVDIKKKGRERVDLLPAQEGRHFRCFAKQ
jgi:hypothetical protein